MLLALSGDIDELAADELRDAIAEATSGGTRSATVDLVDVTLLPSFAVGVMALTRRDLNQIGQDLELVAAAGSIAAAVLMICGLPFRTI